MDRFKTEFSKIEYLDTWDDLTGRQLRTDYKWVGESPYVLVDWLHMDLTERLEYGHKINIGTFRLIVIELFFMSGELGCVRDDFLLGRLRYWWHRSTYRLDIFYRRSIICLAIYGLADYHEAAIPWSGDIHFIQRLKRYKNAILQWGHSTFSKGK